MPEPPFVATPDNVAVLIVDVQPWFLDGWMAGDTEPLLMRLEYLLGTARVHRLPVVATFERPVEEKGWLPERLERLFPGDGLGRRLVKDSFNCCGEADIRAAIAALDRECIAVCGGETDVCVLQSVLGVLGIGKRVMLLEDALFSSEPNVGPAIRRMEAAGAIPATVKSFEYELRRTVSFGGSHRHIGGLVPGASLPEVEKLPVWSPPTG